MNSERDQENKNREDFATNNYNDKGTHLTPDALRKAEANARKNVTTEASRPKNFDVNYISDEVFAKEEAYLPFTPMSDLIIVLGPRVEAPKHGALAIDEAAANKILEEKLKQLGAAFRVVAISPLVLAQRISLLTPAKDLGFDDDSLEGLANLFFGPGDYITWQSPLRLMKTFTPEDDSLAYYEVRNSDVRFFSRPEQVEAFKPQE